MATALVDGHKRLAWLAAVVLLDINGHMVVLADDEAFDLVMRVAAGSADLDDVAEGPAASIARR